MAWSACVPAATESGETAAAAPARHHAPHRRAGNGLEDRVRVLTKALDLDTSQQAAVRQALEQQRDETRQIWAETSAPSAMRIKATERISEQTADRIRALLNEEQKKKYNPPPPPAATVEASARPDVERWMSKTQSK